MDEYGEEELDADFLVPHYEEVDDLNEKKKIMKKMTMMIMLILRGMNITSMKTLFMHWNSRLAPQLKLEIRII